MTVVDNLSIDQLVEAWDSGRILSSIEMGGIGPGYEQARNTMERIPDDRLILVTSRFPQAPSP